MAISLQNSWNVPPTRWGSPTDVRHAIKINAEKVYNCDPDDYIFVMPMFWGLPLLDYSVDNNPSTNYGAVYKNNQLYFDGVTDRVSIDNFYNTANLSVLALIEINAIDSWVANKRDNADDNQWQLSQFASAIAVSIYNGGSVVGNIQGPDIINTGLRSVCFTTNGISTGFVKLYVDRTEIATDVLTGTMKLGARELRLGMSSWDLLHGLTGSIKNICISNAVKTAEQITLFYDFPYGLYQKVPGPFYLLPITAAGWTGKINSTTNPAKINGVTVANITKVMGQ